MRHIFMQLLVLCICTMTCGQTMVSFNYDKSGNRTSRTTITLKSTASQEEDEDKSEDPFTGQVGELSILIYPNPVKTELTVDIHGLKEDTEASVSLFDQGGHLVLQQDNATGSNLISLSHLPPGTYFMVIRAGNDHTKWKVVKE